MKKFIGYMIKCIIAGVISVILLSLFSMIYYNPPIAIEQPDGITNFKYIPNSGWTFMLEGVGYGKTDSLGYNNAYYRNLSKPDIVFIGSSHLEALQVPQDANCVYLLNEMFDKDDISFNNFKCLNLGASGHFFEVSASNFQYVVNKFKGAKYLVIEVPDVKYSSAMLDEIIDCKFHSPMEKKGLLHETAQKVPFIRLLYKKINESKPTKKTSAEATKKDTALNKASEIRVYAKKMKVILDKISKLSKENNIKPIILLHEGFWEDKNGNIKMNIDPVYKKAFMECCESSGVQVVDVSTDMLNHYVKNHELSYGFSNTDPGDGHLNKTGHRIIAKAMYEYINEMEEQR